MAEIQQVVFRHIIQHADQEAEDNSYREAGANPNNYVCFGSDEETCPADNLYRIIGVFGDEVKLIKSDYATSALLGTNGDYSGDTYKDNTDYYKGNLDVFDAYYWNGNNQNTWSESLLNKINLNTNYLNNIGNDWNNKIANYTWQIGGNTYDNILKNTVKNTYQNEIINPLTNTTYSAKIGLMYVSDYGYAASPESWNTTLLYYDEVKSVNWLYMGLIEWTITHDASSSQVVFPLFYQGFTYGDGTKGYYVVRPVFYLNSDVQIYEGHDGTASDPYRIVIQVKSSVQQELIYYFLIEFLICF